MCIETGGVREQLIENRTSWPGPVLTDNVVMGEPITVTQFYDWHSDICKLYVIY